MILYFSGTGNSEYTAKRIGKVIHDDVIDLFDKIRNKDYSSLDSERPWVIVTPIYAWRIPRIVEEWMMWTELTGSKDIYFVVTCGDSSGNAGIYVKTLCNTKGMHYKGCATLVMPENYIAMFPVPDREKALEIIDQQEKRISTIGRYVKSGRDFPRDKDTLLGKCLSGPVNSIFYPVFVHAKKFYVTEECISCGLCESVCPLSNIHLVNGKPVWGTDCTHCMACICKCPKAAVEYGKMSKGKPRYMCPKEV